MEEEEGRSRGRGSRREGGDGREGGQGGGGGRELFAQYLALYSYKHGAGKESNTLTYDDLSETAEECETFQFLSGRLWGQSGCDWGIFIRVGDFIS
uniref:Uncharacterized protein n=1 Tax=Leptobrachium leishanense TaxID=445787 RepID=A0A8C5PKC2_9ANUR